MPHAKRHEDTEIAYKQIPQTSAGRETRLPKKLLLSLAAFSLYQYFSVCQGKFLFFSDFWSGFFGKFLFAAGAGDGNPALSPGNPDHLPAPGAAVVAVGTVLQSVLKLQKTAVLLMALVAVFGQHTKQREARGDIGQQCQKAIAHEQAHDTQGQGQIQYCYGQLIHTIASCEDLAQPISHIRKHRISPYTQRL